MGSPQTFLIFERERIFSQKYLASDQAYAPRPDPEGNGRRWGREIKGRPGQPPPQGSACHSAYEDEDEDEREAYYLACGQASAMYDDSDEELTPDNAFLRRLRQCGYGPGDAEDDVDDYVKGPYFDDGFYIHDAD